MNVHFLFLVLWFPDFEKSIYLANFCDYKTPQKTNIEGIYLYIYLLLYI